MTAIEFDAVALSLGRRRILSDVSFRVEVGSFVGVLGPNGAGKTSLMRAILGVVPIQSGRITVSGRTATRGHPDIGYVPQFRRGAAQLRLNGFELVLGSVAGQRWGWPFATRADKRKAERALERVNASDLAARPLMELSGGERQRILVAQALIDDPKVLLLDEPLVSLDPGGQREMVAAIRTIADESRITVLFCAHEVNPILRAVDEVLYLGNGHAAIGTPDEVITSAVLSSLYNTPIHVARNNGRIYVMAEDAEFDSAHACDTCEEVGA